MSSKKNAAQKNVQLELGLRDQPTATIIQTATWKTLPATGDQVEALCKMLRCGIEELPPNLTKGEASEKIGEIITRRKKQRALPPTATQLNWLEDHGYNRSAMSERTRGYCSALIFKTKKEKGML